MSGWWSTSAALLLVLVLATTPTAEAPVENSLPAPPVLVNVNLHASGPSLGRWEKFPTLLFRALKERDVRLTSIPYTLDEGFRVDVETLVVCSGDTAIGECAVQTAYVVWFRDRNHKTHELARDVVVFETDDPKKVWPHVVDTIPLVADQVVAAINDGWMEYCAWRERSDDRIRWWLVWDPNITGRDV